tara:strand:- start:44 stop:814 length:771 start_codon:yes stop_codon:yes gene_type:complete
MNTFYCVGLPYVSSHYRGDSNFPMRRKIKEFYSLFGVVKSIYIKDKFVRVIVENTNEECRKFMKMIDESLVGTVNVSWEVNPCQIDSEKIEKRLPKHLKNHRVRMWHTTEIPQKAIKRTLNELKYKQENIACCEFEKELFDSEMELFEKELEFEEANETVYFTKEDLEIDYLVEKFNAKVSMKKNPLIVVFDSDDEDSDDEVEEYKKEYTKEEVLELIKFRLITKKKNISIADMMKLLRYSKDDTIEIMKRYNIIA